MTMPASAATGVMYRTVLGTQYRYDGIAWQLDTITACMGLTGIQGLTGVQGITGVQGSTGSAATNDGYALTFTDAQSVAQRVPPESYGQMRCDQTVFKSATGAAWNRMQDWTGDMSSSTINLIDDKIVIGAGGDGTYMVGFYADIDLNSRSWAQFGVYKDGTRTFPSVFTFESQNALYEWYRSMSGAGMHTARKDTTFELYYCVASSTDIKISPHCRFWAYRIGR
jgi:hypothetical protein